MYICIICICNYMCTTLGSLYTANLDMKRTVLTVFASCPEKQSDILTHHINCRALHSPLQAVGVDEIAPGLLARFCCAHL